MLCKSGVVGVSYGKFCHQHFPALKVSFINLYIIFSFGSYHLFLVMFNFVVAGFCYCSIIGLAFH